MLNLTKFGVFGLKCKIYLEYILKERNNSINLCEIRMIYYSN